MKFDRLIPLLALFATAALFSCSPPPGYIGGGGDADARQNRTPLRSGDQAINRNNIDAILENPSRRPGLATGWGEEKSSSVYNQSFVRTSSKPAGTDAIYYNDKKGITAMSDRTERGYLVEPGSTLEIDGFRTSEDSVAAFKFSSVANSYANMRYGDTRNVGVVGLAVFTRKGRNPWVGANREAEQRGRARAFAEAP